MKKLGIVLLAVLVVFSCSFTALAVNFTPSVEKKDAPAFVKITDKDGNEADAIIVDEIGKETPVINDPDSSLKIVITPVAKKEEAIVTDITGYLVSAQYQIAEAKNVSELTDSMESALKNAKLKATDPALQEVTIDDLVVRDLFDVSLVRDGTTIEQIKEGETISFAIQTDLTADDLFFVLLNCDGKEWKVVTDLQLDENGVLTVTVDTLCAIAIITDAMPEKVLDPNAPISPQTGDTSENVFLFGAVIFGAAATILLAHSAAARKKQTGK